MDTRQTSLLNRHRFGQPLLTGMSLSLCPISLLFLAFFSLALASTASGQEMSISPQTGIPEVAPPPLKVLSKSEKTALDAESQPKSRTSLSLTLMDERLKTAEKLHSSEDYQAMYKELGGFQALLDNQLDFLLRNSSTSDKAVASLKKLEISLHTFTPRIELIRRDIPSEYEPYLKSLLKYVNEAREKALEPLFGDAGQPR